MGKTYIQNAASVLIRKYVNRKGLDLSKEVLWISVSQRAAKLPAVKVGGFEKKSANLPGWGVSVSNLAMWQNFF